MADDYPETLCATNEGQRRSYGRCDACLALADPPPRLKALFSVEDEGRRLTVVEAGAETRTLLEDSPGARAVYQLGEAGPPAVATGMIFLRFAEGVRLKAQAERLAAAGYVIARPHPHAGNAGWVTAASGRPADALARLSALEALTDLLVIEPVLLMERVPRSR